MNLTILDANLWLLPQPISCDNTKRLNDFLTIIDEAKPDIITLQEVWLNHYLDILKTKLPSYSFEYQTTSVFNRSGLVTLTKFKLLKNSVYTFDITKHHNLEERIANKAIIQTEILIKNKPITLFNTHLYMNKSANDRFIKINQTKQLMELIKKHKDVILCGDLNSKSEEIKDLILYFDNRPATDSTWSFDNKYTLYGFNKGPHSETGKRDYVLFRGQDIKIINIKTITTPLVSDHYPILAQIEIKSQ